VSATSEETIALGRRIAAALPKKAIVLLIGTLGAGKTTIAKGIVDGLGVAPPEEVASPTFTLIHEFGGSPARLYHMDLYRLDTAEEVRAIGFEEILDRDAVVLLEWAERFPELLPADRIEIHLEAEEDDSRLIRISGLVI
jgi:tRNA threonylcarbamoyladenosine biosynthesis protein TsaE